MFIVQSGFFSPFLVVISVQKIRIFFTCASSCKLFLVLFFIHKRAVQLPSYASHMSLLVLCASLKTGLMSSYVTTSNKISMLYFHLQLSLDRGILVQIHWFSSRTVLSSNSAGCERTIKSSRPFSDCSILYTIESVPLLNKCLPSRSSSSLTSKMFLEAVESSLWFKGLAKAWNR